MAPFISYCVHLVCIARCIVLDTPLEGFHKLAHLRCVHIEAEIPTLTEMVVHFARQVDSTKFLVCAKTNSLAAEPNRAHVIVMQFQGLLE
jgi:hypothetical protein